MKKILLNHPGTLALVWAFVIFVLCATPGRFIPSASWLELLSFDKLVHAGIFFILCCLFFLYAIKNSQAPAFKWLYFFMGVSYGAILEFMQSEFFSERSADWQDILANSFGCMIALLMIRKLQNFYVR